MNQRKEKLKGKNYDSKFESYKELIHNGLVQIGVHISNIKRQNFIKIGLSMSRLPQKMFNDKCPTLYMLNENTKIKK